MSSNNEELIQRTENSMDYEWRKAFDTIISVIKRKKSTLCSFFDTTNNFLFSKFLTNTFELNGHSFPNLPAFQFIKISQVF